MDRYCTDCLNELYHINLTHDDCGYHMYRMECKRCGELKHIVVSVKLRARGKVLKGAEPE